MQSMIWDFLSSEGFQPHGMCLLWQSNVFWAHVISDILIALSYFSIPIALIYFAIHRADFTYRWVLFLFGGFVFACGFTHMLGIWTMWVPDYGIQASVKAVTALVSMATAIALWPLMPKLLALPSTHQLAEKNTALAAEIATREHAERELRQLNNELEVRVSHRTAELEQRNAELLLAQRSAEKSSAAKSEFLASMSHEVRTPMNGVLGMLDLLDANQLSTDQQEIVHRAKDAAGGLLDVINDILDYSKLEVGSVELIQAPFSPEQTVINTIALLKTRADEKGLELTCDIPECIPDFVVGDARRFRQVLLNLVGNAIKFTSSGAVNVRVHHRAGHDGDATIEVCVKDTGIGIDQETQRNLFKRFHQADPSISRRYGGTGLGLAISKQLIELMDGEVAVESEFGRGSMFKFTANFKAYGGERDSAGAVSEDTRNARPECLNVLLVEDNETNRFHLVHLLTAAGHSVETAENGLQAVDAAEKRQFDVILMDIYMPEMDGLVAAKVIRTLNGPSARTPIVALTASAMVGDRQHYLSSGMDEYVSKPVDANALFAAIWKVIRPRSFGSGMA